MSNLSGVLQLDHGNPFNLEFSMSQKKTIKAWTKEIVSALKQGERDEAVALLIPAMEEHPNSARFWFYWASTRHHFPEILACLKKAYSLDPADSKIAQSLKKSLLLESSLYLKEGKRSKARDSLEQAWELAPFEEEIWLRFATIEENPARKLEYLEEASRLAPENEKVIAWKKELEALLNAPSPSESCPFCQSPLPEPYENCSECKAIVSLRNPEAFLSTPHGDRDWFLGWISNLGQESTTDGLPTEKLWKLGLAFLNVQDFALGIPVLQRAVSQGLPVPNVAENLDRLEALVKQRELEAQTPSPVPSEPEFQTGSVDDESVEIIFETSLDETQPGWVPPAEEEESAPSAVQESEKKAVQLRQVLIAEDSATVRRVLRRTLEAEGCKVFEARDGMESLGKANAAVYDLIFMDIQMPLMDGYQVCKLVRGSKGLNFKTPIIFLTGSDGFFDKVRGRMAGADRYLTKPFKREQILDALEHFAPLSQ